MVVSNITVSPKIAIYIGIDVSKDHLDLASRFDRTDNPEGKYWRVSYTESSVRQLVVQLQGLQPQLIVMEATGGLETSVAAALATAGLPVAIVNPRQTRDFAKATGQLAKTDSIDARGLAHFAQAIKPKVTPVPDPEAQQLKAALSRRGQLVKMLVEEKNRLGVAHPSVKPDIEENIDCLEKRIKQIDLQLRQQIQQSSIWCEKLDILTSVKGVGEVTAITLLAELPELGTLSRKKIAKLAGLAPLNDDSGKKKGKRRIWGGRARVRSILYMAALTAIRWNPVIKSFYDRLIAQNKCFKVAITACMRKLLVILNAMLKNKTLWQSQTA
jgi:transposase